MIDHLDPIVALAEQVRRRGVAAVSLDPDVREALWQVYRDVSIDKAMRLEAWYLIQEYRVELALTPAMRAD